MQVIDDKQNLRLTVSRWRMQGEAIAFVPTMGNLHDGHMSLVHQAKSRAERCVVSIFVNHTQFGPSEDFQRYPRSWENDQALCAEKNVDVIYAPSVQTMYPSGEQKSSFVEVPALSQILCGQFRPGHFRGVATVVAVLLNQVQPDLLLLGEKDYQQCLVIQRMIDDLAFPVKIVTAGTVRESNGLALSSRNQYLSDTQREQAGQLHQVLQATRKSIKAGRDNMTALEQQAIVELTEAGFKVDYVVIRDKTDLSMPKTGRDSIILVAAWLGESRLIDNLTV